MPGLMRNTLYYGDNLQVMREHIPDESVDLVYLDPPFNSNANYNQLFAEHDGSQSAAQIKAFEDTWRWDQAAAKAYDEIVLRGGRVSDTMQAFHTILGSSNMLAYLAMMAPRLVELHRVLKSSGSLYLHCDPTASHYLKLVLDAVFDVRNFRSEIIWKRTSAHSSARRPGPVHDILLFYSASDDYTWKAAYTPYDQDYLDTFFDSADEAGKRYKRTDLTGAGVSNGDCGKPWRGIDVTAKGRHWMHAPEMLDKLDASGRIHWPKKADGMPRLKQFPEDLPGVPLQDVWTDIRPLHNLAAERLGYPTQKPQELLERIINASSHPGDVVLDPFCGCGTAVTAAQKLGRQWIGVDITHLAVNLIKRRIKESFGEGAQFQVVGEPVSLPDAEQLAAEDPYQFQWWALSMVDARVHLMDKKKGADGGIDGKLLFEDDADRNYKQVIFSVKAGKTQAAHLRDLRGVVQRENAAIGVLVCLQKPTSAMRKEAATAGRYHSPGWNTDHPRIQILTIEQLLDGKAVDMPPIRQVNATFKRAGFEAKDLSAAQKGLDFS